MASRNDRGGSAGGVSRQMGGAGGAQMGFGTDNNRFNRGGGSRGRGGGRSRRSRFFRFRGTPRGSRTGGNREREELPSNPTDWELKIESEGDDAFLDLSLCFNGTSIPYTEAMADDLVNLCLVGGQEVQAVLLAGCRSMQHGVALEPDGSQVTVESLCEPTIMNGPVDDKPVDKEGDGIQAIVNDELGSTQDSSSDSKSSNDSSGSSTPHNTKRKKTKVARKRKKTSTSTDADDEDSGESASSDDDQSSVESQSIEAFKTPAAETNRGGPIANHSLASPKLGVVTINEGIVDAKATATGGVSDQGKAVVMRSPVVITPAKSMILQAASPCPIAPVILPAPPVMALPMEAKLVDTGPGVVAKPIVPEDNQNGAGVNIQPMADQLQLNVAMMQGGAGTSGSKSQQSSSKVKQKKIKKSKKSSEQYKEERYNKKVLKLNRLLDEAEKGKARKSEKEAAKVKGGKKPKEKKKKSRNKKKKADYPTSTEDESSEEDSSSSESSVGGAPDRIAKISQGRAFQQLAMARAKEIGVIRDGDLKATEIMAALRALETTEFVITPDHAYYLFHRVPGTGLPHLDRHIRELCDRYGRLVKLVAKYHLEKALQLCNEKKNDIGPQFDNNYNLLWQFQNDLTRAPALTNHLQKPVIVNDPTQAPAGNRAAAARLKPKHRSGKKSKKVSKKAASKRKAKSRSRKRSSSESEATSGKESSRGKGSRKKRRRTGTSSE